jgi:hypothetical protein
MSDENPDRHKALRRAERERLAKNQLLNTDTYHQQRHRGIAARQRAEDLARERAAATTAATAGGESRTEQGMLLRQYSNLMRFTELLALTSEIYIILIQMCRKFAGHRTWR